MADGVLMGLHLVNSPWVWGTVITLVFMSASVGVQEKGEKRGGLIIGIPCSMVALGGLAKAYNEPQNRVTSLIGSGLATAGAIISTAPAMIKNDDQARETKAIYPTTVIATGLGLSGCALINAGGQLAVANPVAPIVQAVQQNPAPIVVVNNPMNH